MLIDAYELVHWMNVRKLTPTLVADRAGVGEQALAELLNGDRRALPDDAALRLAESLQVAAAQIAADENDERPPVITATGEELRATRRAIRRDGIHFYNYYSMAGAPGGVAPVVLDILCPAGRVPALNNGHLEPAITVNLGPGDIHGRWGRELCDATWSVLEANRGEDAWIAGDSYVEPSYCPHSYSLASAAPARIVSYTAESQLASLLKALNAWPDAAFEALLERLGDAGPAAWLGAELARRCHTPESAARAAGVPEHSVAAFLAGDAGALGPDEWRRLGAGLGFDHRLLVAAPSRHDAAGKTCCTIAESRRSVRAYAGYTVASMAMAPQLPDLTGLFLRVGGGDGQLALELWSTLDTHYLVLSGDVTLTWADGPGMAAASLGADGSAWVAPCVAHGWVGEGALLRLGSGRHLSRPDALELTSTFAPAATLRRGRRTRAGWGYDGDGAG